MMTCICGRSVSMAFVAMFDYCPTCNASPFPEENLAHVVRKAKIAAGLDPDKKHLPMLFHEHIPAEWRERFWKDQLDRFLSSEQCDSAYVLASHGGGTDLMRCMKPKGHSRPQHLFTNKITGERTLWLTGDQNEKSA